MGCSPYGSLLLNPKVFCPVGRDEYGSAEQRANVEAARNAGVHLAFFSGNEVLLEDTLGKFDGCQQPPTVRWFVIKKVPW